MGSEKVKLMGFWVSPFSKRVEWALKLKGVEYEYIEEDIFNKSPLLLELNPIHKKVPVFVHGENVLAESLVILEYIDETWKQNPLLPQDLYERAVARFWAKFADEKLSEAGFMVLSCTGERQEKAVKLAVEAVEKIEGELKKRKNKFLGGESIGYLDLALGSISYWLPIWEEVASMEILDSLKFPATVAWMNNFLNQPVIKDTLTPRDQTLVFIQKHREQFSM